MPGRNGKRRPPRPSIQVRAPSATPAEAAAIAAALQHFLAETAPVAEPRPAVSPWQRAALTEGIASRRVEPTGWGPALGR